MCFLSTKWYDYLTHHPMGLPEEGPVRPSNGKRCKVLKWDLCPYLFQVSVIVKGERGVFP